MLLGERDRVASLAGRLTTSASSVFAYTDVSCIARTLGDAMTFLGDQEQAKAYYQQALEQCQKVRFRPEIALTRLGLAELLLEEAASYQRSAVSARSPLPEGEGTDGGGAGGGLTADRLKADGLEHLDFAIAEFREMKMQPALERALKHKGLLGA